MDIESTKRAGTGELRFEAPVITEADLSAASAPSIVELAARLQVPEKVSPIGSLAFDLAESFDALDQGALDKLAGSSASILKTLGAEASVYAPLKLVEATGAFARSDGASLVPAAAKIVKTAGSTLAAFDVPGAAMVGQVGGVVGSGAKMWIELADGVHDVQDGIAIISFAGKAASLLSKAGVGPDFLGVFSAAVSVVAPVVTDVVEAAAATTPVEWQIDDLGLLRKGTHTEWQV